MIYILILFILSGCATARHIANPTTPDKMALKAANEDIEVTLDYIIVPDGPGSWISGAKWNEYILSFRNNSGQDLHIQNVNLLDPRGVYSDSGRTSPHYTPEHPDHVARMLLQSPIRHFALSSILPLLPMGALVGTGGAVTQGVFGLGSMLPDRIDDQNRKTDHENIMAELKKRNLKLPISLAPGGALQGSVFFSPEAAAKSMVVNYKTGGTERQVRIDIP